MSQTFVVSLLVYTGTDFDQTFVLEDTQSNSVKDLTGYTACAQMRRYESSSKTADFLVSFANDRKSGRITISLTSSATTNIKPGKYFYDLLISDAAGTVTRAVEGTILVKRAVTRI